MPNKQTYLDVLEIHDDDKAKSVNARQETAQRLAQSYLTSLCYLNDKTRAYNRRESETVEKDLLDAHAKARDELDRYQAALYKLDGK